MIGLMKLLIRIAGILSIFYTLQQKYVNISYKLSYYNFKSEIQIYSER
jgi:hypothetical protein